MIDTPKVELEVIYRAPMKYILGLFFLFLPLSIFLLLVENTNTKWVTIFNAAVLFMIAMMSVMALILRLRDSRISITSEGVWMPGPVWSSAPRFYEFSSIKAIKIWDISGVKILECKTNQSRFNIASGNLTSPEEFYKIVSLIQQRCHRHVP